MRQELYFCSWRISFCNNQNGDFRMLFNQKKIFILFLLLF
jgi:hypothetical protein